MSRWRTAACTLLLLAGACRGGGDRPIRVGSKNFTEQVILGEIAAQALERAGLKVERKLDLGGSFVCHRALVAGELDLYPEYSGTAFTAILKRKPIADPGPPCIALIVVEKPIVLTGEWGRLLNPLLRRGWM